MRVVFVADDGRVQEWARDLTYAEAFSMVARCKVVSGNLEIRS